jgi:predicted Rossmann fold flavoprotein
LQISSYWREGEDIRINLLPDMDIFEALREQRGQRNKALLHNVLGLWLPNRLAELVAQQSGFDAPLPDLSDDKLRKIAARLHDWHVRPVGTEGYRTAEVTLGGVDTAALSSKTMEARDVPGLYFIGEVVDVTGHLGGFNFQWAWASGWVAGQYA